MKIKIKILLAIWLVIILSSLLFPFIGYRAQKRAFLHGVDKRLFTSAVMLKSTLPADYHDNLNKDSFTPKQYDTIIVDKNNKLCLELDLQYLWSCMIVDGDIVFTTSTSPSKDIANKDHAGFFEVHRDPHAFDTVFATMKPDYSSFHNEWGHGRMVLFPYIDKNGRPYCFGSSVSTDYVYTTLQKTASSYLYLFSIILVVGFIVSMIISNSFSRPIVKLTHVADDIAKGNLGQTVKVSGSSELSSLSESISSMSRSIRRNMEELQEAKKQLEELASGLEQKVEERTRDLTEAQERLIRSEKLAILGKVAGSLSHELRTPLGVIKNSIYYLNTSKVRSEASIQKKYLEIMKDQIDIADKIIANALDYVRPRKLDMTEDDINEVIDSALAEIEMPKGIDVRKNYSKGIVVLADSFQMKQAFVNILINSIQAIRGKGVITITTEKGNGFITAVFEDNGKGIPEGNKEKLFEPLFSTKARGIGLGLAIIKDIVEKHKGRVSIESRFGEGTTVTVKLPRA
ncbi:MAG: ATP-binding protein [bacterium]